MNDLTLHENGWNVVHVPYPPKSQGRPRLAKHGRRLYDPSAKDKKVFSMLVKALKPNLLRQGVEVYIKFQMPRPKYHHTKTGKKTKAWRYYHTKTPDIDNLLKFTLDACKGILWEDDRQICSMASEKIYNNSGGIQIRYRSIADTYIDYVPKNYNKYKDK